MELTLDVGASLPAERCGCRAPCQREGEFRRAGTVAAACDIGLVALGVLEGRHQALLLTALEGVDAVADGLCRHEGREEGERGDQDGSHCRS